MKLSLEDRINLMRAIEDYPIENQRQLAEVINLSLGKTNFILKSLIKVGLVKLSNFRDSDNKFGYTSYHHTSQDGWQDRHCRR